MTDNSGIYTAPWEKALERVLTPLEEFIHRQTTSGVLLMICAVIALLIANSALSDEYQQFLHTYFKFNFGDSYFGLSLHHWINDALMVSFFFVMGLELKREFLVGELASPRQALLPILAALGGMIVPAAVYLAFNPSGYAAQGWGVPMATDIAFAIGALSLLGARIPKNLLTFLIALAIIDDLGAVMVIALFYTADINVSALFGAVLMTLLLIALNLMGVRRTLVYVIVGIILWLFTLKSGVHATIAGVILAFTIPIRPKYDANRFLTHVGNLLEKMRQSLVRGQDIIRNDELRSQVSALANGVTLVQAPAQRLEQDLHLPVAYLVIPIFALANAGIPFEGGLELLQDRITLGVFFGLFVGKLVGIALPTWLAYRFNIAPLPEGVSMSHIIGVSMLGGIGFTMSIFIADLGFINYPMDLLKAKTGILLASLVSGVGGIAWLLIVSRR